MTDGPLFRNTTFRTSIVVLLLTVLFDRLFWHQGLGLNLAHSPVSAGRYSTDRCLA